MHQTISHYSHSLHISPHRSEVYFPSGSAVHGLVRGVAPPHSLDEPRGCGDLAIKMLLTLLLLNLQCKPGAQNTLEMHNNGLIHDHHITHTAGKAKNEMANTEKQDATIFPIHVFGTVSPYLQYQPIRIVHHGILANQRLSITRWLSQ